MSSFWSKLLAAPPRVIEFSSFAQWWADTAEVRASHTSTVERAISLGFCADRVAMAFAGGYTSAVLALDSSLSLSHEPGAFCATEDGGAHPRAITTKLVDGRVTGTKRFVSFGTFAKTLLVVASEGAQADGRNRLKVVRVAASAPGVSLQDGAELPFVPEVPHASVQFDSALGEVLEGDGYEQFLKPFRSIEDLHVQAAVLAYVLNLSLRFGWPEAIAEQVLMVLTSATALGLEDPRSPSTHLMLAGLLAQSDAVLRAAEPHLALVDTAERERFVRDRPLMKIAGKAREARRVRAWQLVRGTHD